MTPSDFALLSSLVLAFALVSKRLAGTVLTGPMLAVLAGMAVGPTGLGWLQISLGEGPLHVLAELTLVFVLFGDATRIDLSALRRELGLPVRLLGIGLPLSIALGGLLAKTLFPALSWWEAATLGAVLAPTDAALGQAVVSSPDVPQRIRQALNVESGLNDGIALPFVLLFASLACMGHDGGRTASEWVQFGLMQVTLGPLVGGLVAWLVGGLIHRAIVAGAVEESFERLAGLALALLCFGAAELVGGNGFIAAFVGGMTFGTTQRDRCHSLLSFLEAEGQLLMLLVFFGVGASLAWVTLENATLPAVLYAALSLTVVRMLPVSLSLFGSRMHARTHLFLGWFGPRGLASVLYGILLVSVAPIPHREMVFSVVMLTALLSVLLHGITAAPGARWYGRHLRDGNTECSEQLRVTAHPTR